MTLNFPFFLHKITWYNSILWRACTLYRNKQAYYNSLFLSHIVTYQRWTRTFTTYMYLLMKISSIISAFAVVTQSIRSYILLENSKRVKCIRSIIYCIAHQYQWMFYTFSFYHAFLAKIICLDTTVLGIDTISVVNKSGTMDIFQT